MIIFRNEECIEYSPVKLMKFESKSALKSANSNYYRNNMNKKEYSFEDEEECPFTQDVTRKWGSSYMMARQSIHENHESKYTFNPPAPLDKRIPEFSVNSNSLKKPLFEINNGDEIDVKFAAKSSSQNHGKINKSKGVTSRLSNSYQTSNSKQTMDKSKSSFQPSVKKKMNFLQESYRLHEKAQYMQLLHQQTTKFNSFVVPFNIQKVGFQKHLQKSSIPVIDLTKEKNNTVNKSRENIPWTSSWAKSSITDDLALLETTSETKEVPKINSLQDMLKTHTVTEENLVDEILSRHATETARKQKQVEIEAAKLKVLTESNRKAYAIALEEKLRQYMRITTPVLEEREPIKEKYVLPDLSKEQEQKISSVLVASPAGEVLVEKFGLQIKRRDLQTLKGLNWLNDEVINFYMNLIMERGKNEKMPNVYAFNTFFYPKLLSGGHVSLKRWTKKVDIFSHDMILVPIHLGMHWCMAVIDFRSKEVKYYDSMGSSNNRCLQALLSYLEAESLDKKKVPFKTKDWERINVENIPQQMNGSDCGVFSCMFAEHLARDSQLLFSQDHMPYFRRKMALEIVEAKLLT